MNFDKIRSVVLIISLTLLSGFFDARGFYHAANIWQKGRLIWESLFQSFIGFSIGIMSYWIVIKYLKEVGIVMPELQTLIWFVVAIIGVAFLSGHFFHWQRIDQFISLGIVFGLGWLLFRIGK